MHSLSEKYSRTSSYPELINSIPLSTFNPTMAFSLQSSSPKPLLLNKKYFKGPIQINSFEKDSQDLQENLDPNETLPNRKRKLHPPHNHLPTSIKLSRKHLEGLLLELTPNISENAQDDPNEYQTPEKKISVIGDYTSNEKDGKFLARHTSVCEDGESRFISDYEVVEVIIEY